MQYGFVLIKGLNVSNFSRPFPSLLVAAVPLSLLTWFTPDTTVYHAVKRATLETNLQLSCCAKEMKRHM